MKNVCEAARVDMPLVCFHLESAKGYEEPFGITLLSDWTATLVPVKNPRRRLDDDAEPLPSPSPVR